MTEHDARAAAKILDAAGHYAAADAMLRQAETLRKQHFQDMAARCDEDMDFALAYGEDARDRWDAPTLEQ
jgi:hypothetical protein